jgi:hypothetical protein
MRSDLFEAERPQCGFAPQTQPKRAKKEDPESEVAAERADSFRV